MDIAIVTGASSSLGLAISKRLIQMGFRVYGVGGDYTDCSLQNVNFKPVACDLADPEAVENAARSILEKEKGVYVLVNNAKYYGRKSFFETDRNEIERVLNINLLCPLILTRALSDSLVRLQGYLIQLGSPYAETSRGGPVGAAASGGLKWMGEVLFHDLRDHGVKVCHLSPEPNRGRDPRVAARPGARIEAAIDPEAVAQAIEQILQSRFGNIVTEMVLRPLRVKEPEHDPVVRLPYPQPKPVPYTVPREMIEAEEQLESEEYERKDALRRKKRESREREEPTKPERKDPEEDENPEQEAAPRKSARKRRPRSGRKPRPEEVKPDADKAPRMEEKPKPEQKRPEKSPREERKAPAPAPEQPESVSSESRRRRSRRKPRPPMTSVGFLNRSKEPAPSPSEPAAEKPSPSPAKNREQPADKPVEKVPAKKAARKTVKKAARKTTATKKTARKATAKKAAPRKKASPNAAGKGTPESD